MPVRVIESKQNARVKELRKALADAGRGGSARASGAGLVGIEGPNLVEEALRAGLRVKTIFVAQGSERLLDALSLPAETEILALPKKLLDSALATETPQPIAALIEPPQWTWENVLGPHRKSVPLMIVLAGLQDPGNLGTIVRSAEAFGAKGIVSLPGTVSAWNQKAVRASAGSVFRVPVLAASERACFEQLGEAGVKILATSSRAAQPAELVDLAGPVALIIGNEGKGISTDLMAKVDAHVTIPCPGPVESLNAGVAASVLLYEAARQRAAHMSPSLGIPQASSKTPGRGAGARR
ncbi:MAG TPA: RNA methyltransferase [Terracidiphilus sp.]|nr:RNA methyltransferase [Terracidiphilus sp.]